MKPSQRERNFSSRLPIALTIAGSDCSGGAGIQADLRAWNALGIYGCSALTCIVAEHSGRVAMVEPSSPSCLHSQIQLVLENFPLAAIKIGMIVDALRIRTIVRALEGRKPHLPLVIDPILLASSGAPLLEQEALPVLLQELLPLATLITPNRYETAALTCQPIHNQEDLQQAGLHLSTTLNTSVLVKGGHFPENKDSIDFLCHQGHITPYPSLRQQGADPRGTGCTLSAAITGFLAHGFPLVQAIARAKDFLTPLIATAPPIGSSHILWPHQTFMSSSSLRETT